MNPTRVRPIPGAQAIEYRKGDTFYWRCSRCRRETAISPLLDVRAAREPAAFNPVMLGDVMVGIACNDCLHAMTLLIQSIFPDKHAFPFVDARGHLLPNPTCEEGHALLYTSDGAGMACDQCDVQRPELFEVPDDEVGPVV